MSLPLEAPGLLSGFAKKKPPARPPGTNVFDHLELGRRWSAMRTTQQKQDTNVGASSSAGHGASSRRPPIASWEALLRQAINTPGMIHEAYQRFHQYSLRN